MAPRLIFEFNQPDFENLCASVGPFLERLKALGCRFSLDRVADFSFDVQALADRGFSFLKLASDKMLRELEPDAPLFQAVRQAKIEIAHDYYSRFDNISSGPGIVEHGMIAPLPRKQTIDELADSLLICTPSEMIDKLAVYADLGVDRFILNISFGAEQGETLDNIQLFAEEVMPHFTTQDAPVSNAV